jgi:hypothetical protein
MRVIATWAAFDVACMENTQRFRDREYTILPKALRLAVCLLHSEILTASQVVLKRINHRSRSDCSTTLFASADAGFSGLWEICATSPRRK